MIDTGQDHVKRNYETNGAYKTHPILHNYSTDFATRYMDINELTREQRSGLLDVIHDYNTRKRKSEYHDDEPDEKKVKLSPPTAVLHYKLPMQNSLLEPSEPPPTPPSAHQQQSMILFRKPHTIKPPPFLKLHQKKKANVAKLEQLSNPSQVCLVCDSKYVGTGHHIHEKAIPVWEELLKPKHDLRVEDPRVCDDCNNRYRTQFPCVVCDQVKPKFYLVLAEDVASLNYAFHRKNISIGKICATCRAEYNERVNKMEKKKKKKTLLMHARLTRRGIEHDKLIPVNIPEKSLSSKEKFYAALEAELTKKSDGAYVQGSMGINHVQYVNKKTHINVTEVILKSGVLEDDTEIIVDYRKLHQKKE
jgi:hypothetical protein